MNLRPLAPVAALVISTSALAHSHCRTGETDYFSCQIANSRKIVSVCGNVEDDGSGDFGWLQYRFGPAGHIELAYPKQRDGSVSVFEGNAFGRYRIVELRFVSGDVLYTVALSGKFGGDPSVGAVSRPEPTGEVEVAYDSSRHTTLRCGKVNEHKYFETFQDVAATLRRVGGDTDIAYDFYKRKNRR